MTECAFYIWIALNPWKISIPAYQEFSLRGRIDREDNVFWLMRFRANSIFHLFRRNTRMRGRSCCLQCVRTSHSPSRSGHPRNRDGDHSRFRKISEGGSVVDWVALVMENEWVLEKKKVPREVFFAIFCNWTLGRIVNDNKYSHRLTKGMHTLIESLYFLLRRNCTFKKI